MITLGALAFLGLPAGAIVVCAISTSAGRGVGAVAGAGRFDSG